MKAKFTGGIPSTSQSLDSVGLLGKWLMKDETSSQTYMATKHVNKRLGFFYLDYVFFILPSRLN